MTRRDTEFFTLPIWKKDFDREMDIVIASISRRFFHFRNGGEEKAAKLILGVLEKMLHPVIQIFIPFGASVEETLYAMDDREIDNLLHKLRSVTVATKQEKKRRGNARQERKETPLNP